MVCALMAEDGERRGNLVLCYGRAEELCVNFYIDGVASFMFSVKEDEGMSL